MTIIVIQLPRKIFMMKATIVGSPPSSPIGSKKRMLTKTNTKSNPVKNSISHAWSNYDLGVSHCGSCFNA